MVRTGLAASVELGVNVEGSTGATRKRPLGSERTTSRPPSRNQVQVGQQDAQYVVSFTSSVVPS